MRTYIKSRVLDAETAYFCVFMLIVMLVLDAQATPGAPPHGLGAGLPAPHRARDFRVPRVVWPSTSGSFEEAAQCATEGALALVIDRLFMPFTCLLTSAFV